jgi:hypothetical protein
MSNRRSEKTRRPSPQSKRSHIQEWGTGENDDSQDPDPADEDLPGTIFAVPDWHWGFEAIGREDHPGICTAYYVAAMEATLVKGRDAATDRGPERTRFVVDASQVNGLRKRTSFQLVPARRSLRQVRLLFTNRRMGTLEKDLFDELKERMSKLFPQEG